MQTRFTSAHNLSILWLWTERSAMKLPLLHHDVPCDINPTISCYSWRVLKTVHSFSKKLKRGFRTVISTTSSMNDRLLNPSTQPRMTMRCHVIILIIRFNVLQIECSALEHGKLFSKLRTYLRRIFVPTGSILKRLPLPLSLWVLTFLALKLPIIYTSPL